MRRLFREFPRGRIQTWIKITEAAMHEKPLGFPGFRVSPAAFLIDGISESRIPPDWIHVHEKRQAAQRWEQEQAKYCHEELALQGEYRRAREAALQAHLETPEGRRQYENAYNILRVFYNRVEPHRSHEAAADAARGKIERDHLPFPDFGVWLLEQQSDNH